jgi:hypothetical protein
LAGIIGWLLLLCGKEIRRAQRIVEGTGARAGVKNTLQKILLRLSLIGNFKLNRRKFLMPSLKSTAAAFGLVAAATVGGIVAGNLGRVGYDLVTGTALTSEPQQYDFIAGSLAGLVTAGAAGIALGRRSRPVTPKP